VEATKLAEYERFHITFRHLACECLMQALYHTDASLELIAFKPGQL
jgi:hypothetical protein